jgi:hypothetical protein
MLSAAKTLLSLKVEIPVPGYRVVTQNVPRAREKRKAAIVARQLIRLCAESEQD